MAAYQQLTGAGATTRDAAAMTGIARSSADRDWRRPSPSRASRSVPANALTAAERQRVLTLLDSPQFVDAAPAQMYAALLDQGVYVGSIATMYRILREHRQVKERRRLARHPARNRPELVADAPRQVFSRDITKLAGPVKGSYFDAYVGIDPRGRGGDVVAWALRRRPNPQRDVALMIKGGVGDAGQTWRWKRSPDLTLTWSWWRSRPVACRRMR